MPTNDEFGVNDTSVFISNKFMDKAIGIINGLSTLMCQIKEKKKDKSTALKKLKEFKQSIEEIEKKLGLSQKSQVIKRLGDRYEKNLELIEQFINKSIRESEDSKKMIGGIKEELAGLESKQTSYAHQMEKLNKRITALEKRIKEAKEDLEDLKTKWWIPVYGQYKASKILIVDDIFSLKEDIKVCKQLSKRAANAEVQIRQLKEIIRNNKKKIKKINYRIATLKREREYAQSDRKECKEAIVMFSSAYLFFSQLIQKLHSLTNDLGLVELTIDYIDDSFELDFGSGKKKMNINTILKKVGGFLNGHIEALLSMQLAEEEYEKKKNNIENELEKLIEAQVKMKNEMGEIEEEGDSKEEIVFDDLGLTNFLEDISNSLNQFMEPIPLS